MDAGNTLESQINRSDYKILIVDDVVSNVLLLKILLTNEKFQVCTASNGNTCIEQAKKEHPDLILLDVMMPDLSGFDVAVILKKDPEAVIVLHGMSMGAATVLMTTGEKLPSAVKAAVADSSYTNAIDESAYVYLNLNPHPIPARPLLRTVRRLTLRKSRYDLDMAAPEEAVKRSVTPTLFIHGEKDGFIPPSMMPVLYNNAACPKAFLWIPGADHVEGIDIDPGTYWKGVEKFLNGVDPAILKGED